MLCLSLSPALCFFFIEIIYFFSVVFVTKLRLTVRSILYIWSFRLLAVMFKLTSIIRFVWIETNTCWFFRMYISLDREFQLEVFFSSSSSYILDLIELFDKNLIVNNSCQFMQMRINSKVEKEEKNKSSFRDSSN